jgi:hypothetical protein
LEPLLAADTVDLSHGFLAVLVGSAYLNGIGIVDNPVQNGVRNGRLRELAVPASWGELRTEDCGSSLVSCMDDLQQIHCRILAEDSLFISIRNTSVPVEIVDNMIATTKKNKQNHRYGLQQVHFILDKQNAEYSFSYEDGWFQFVAEIPIP